jgi:methionyl aminopeptidase
MTLIPIKSAVEQEKMRRGGQILAKILIELKNRCIPGVTKKELDELARRLCLKHHVKPSFLGYGGYPAALCVSVNNEVVHGLPTDTIINKGDLVSLDMGVEYEGFHTDSALTLICGNIQNPEAEKLIKTAERCFFAGADLVRDGIRLGDISSKVQEIAEKEGFGVIKMLVGHGIGREVHEDPHVPNYGEPGTGPILKTGMTIAIEPMLTMDGSVVVILSDDKWTYVTKTGALATHFEHTILVTDDGCEILTEKA